MDCISASIFYRHSNNIWCTKFKATYTTITERRGDNSTFQSWFKTGNLDFIYCEVSAANKNTNDTIV